MALRTRIPALLSILVLGSCGSVPLGSLAELGRIDFETTDLVALRTALRLPDGLQPRPGGVKMDALVKVSGAPDRKTTFVLTAARDSSDSTGLSDARRAGFSIYAYRLSQDDVGRLESIRSELFRYRREGKSASLGLGIAAKEFCLEKPLSAGPVLSTTYLLTSETHRYVIVTQDLDLRKEPAIKDQLATLGSC
jgi:hypothetical protein